MVEKFLDYLQHEKGYSEHTTKSYANDLQGVNHFLDSEFELNLLTANHSTIRSWMANSLETGLSARSVRRKVSALRSFYKWRKKVFGDTQDPTSRLILPKVSKRLPVFVDEAGLDTLKLNEYFTDDFTGLRDRAIVEIFYQTGIRSAELIGLKCHNVNTAEKTIKVYGKRKKERIVPFSPELGNLLNSYEKLRGEIAGGGNSNFYFLTSKGKKLYPKLVYRVVNGYLSQASTLSKKSPHVLRHTFATHMLNKGADINAVKELLGHGSLAATQVYTHNSVEQLLKVYQGTHPKS